MPEPRVPRRARLLSTYDIRELEHLACVAQEDLWVAALRAQATIGMERAQRVYLEIEAACRPWSAWPDAIGAIYAAHLATYAYARISDADVKELTRRWDAVTGDKLGEIASRAGARQMADKIAAAVA